ncbi:MAG: response regulator [Bacteroidales bacterium]|nr:response regulator [Bacteroidales bacterium]
MKKDFILIVDDEALNLFFLREILSDYNLHILEATNGREAVDLCDENPEIKLVLMYIKMPVMDGLEATKIIKSKFPEKIVVAQTAYAFAYDENIAIEAGCDDYLFKPLSLTSLNEVLKKFQIG